MIYYLLYPLHEIDALSFFNVFRYITFRAAYAAVTALVLCFLLGPPVVRWLRRLQVVQPIRKEGPGTHMLKEGTPTMGGVFVIGSILIAVLLWADLNNRYIVLTLLTCFYLAILGFIDDYVKLKKKGRRARGMKPRTKFLWQTLLGCFIGSYVYFNPDTTTGLDIPFFKNLFFNIGIFYIRT